jgi:hypothetical protein
MQYFDTGPEGPRGREGPELEGQQEEKKAKPLMLEIIQKGNFLNWSRGARIRWLKGKRHKTRQNSFNGLDCHTP